MSAEFAPPVTARRLQEAPPASDAVRIDAPPPVGAVPADAVAPSPEIAPRLERGRIITVLSPKGGLGKTTLAVNLAVGLARVAPEAVVLVDADLQFGDIANVLALEPQHTLPEMVTGLASGDDIIVKTLLTPHPAGFFTVCGAESPVDGENVTGEQLAGLIQQLAATFAYVVVDTTPALGEHTLAVLDQATDAVAMSSLAVPNLRSLRTELAVLRQIGFAPQSRHLVLNQAVQAGGLVPKDAEAILQEPVDIVIPHSKAVPISTNRGNPVLLDSPKDPAAKAITELLSRLTGLPAKAFLGRRTA